MTEKIREILDGREMPVDYWLYRIQEKLGFGHEACKSAEELRGVVKFFEERGLKFPILPTPDLYTAGQRSVPVSLGRMKLPVNAAYNDGRLSEPEKNKAKRFNQLCRDIRTFMDRDSSTC